MLSFYCFGAGIIDSFALYHSWLFVGANEFAAIHQAGGQRIVLFFVFPMVILTIITILLFWYRPQVIPKHLLWYAFACQLISWLSSAFIQIPIQLQLDQGKDEVLLSRLITTDWIRIIAWVIYIVIVVQMFTFLFSGVDSRPTTFYRRPSTDGR
ncbi:MAG: hypothetical protein H7122_11760 [Chitinophagaceae bacterium]|nr:hypothetical protein [Chitinophagaceae bacterium]